MKPEFNELKYSWDLKSKLWETLLKFRIVIVRKKAWVKFRIMDGLKIVKTILLLLWILCISKVP